MSGIVFASHTSRGGPFVVGSHHLVRALAADGHRVLHVSRPFTPPELLDLPRPEVRARAGLAGRTRILDGVAEVLPLSPVPMGWACRRFLRTGRNAYLAGVPRIPRAVQRHVGHVDALVVDEPRMAGIEDRVAADVLVYRATDITPAMSPYPFAAPMEAHLAQAAHGLVATSQPVLDHLLSIAPEKPSLLLENGVDTDHFQTPAARPADYRDDRRRIVYVGALDGRFDAEAVAAMARAHPDDAFPIIGPRHQLSDDARRALELPNVDLLGPRAYADLPGYLQHADVGLLPLSDHSANRGRSPMKIHEYLAAGIPVVATKTEELERRATPHVHLYGDPAAALEQALQDPAAGAVEVARRHDWHAQAQRLASFLEGLRPRS